MSVPEFKKIAFEGPKAGPDRGYTFRASYLKEPNNGDAMIEIFKDGQPLRRFLFPAYKIWNIAAHFGDIVDGEIEVNSSGYEMAAWTGFPNAIVIGSEHASPICDSELTALAKSYEIMEDEFVDIDGRLVRRLP
jgi:hypothetical protein